jgi:hypothetical protein
LNNASNLNSAAFADDQTALVVPAPSLIPDNVVFNGSAYGVHATCQSITSQCLNKTDTGPEAWLALNCSTSTIFNFSTPYNATTKTFGALNTSGVILDPNSFGIDSKCVYFKCLTFRSDDFMTSPFSLAAVVTSFAYVSTSGDDECRNFLFFWDCMLYLIAFEQLSTTPASSGMETVGHGMLFCVPSTSSPPHINT